MILPLLLAIATPLPAAEIRGRVISVTDGDTITVLDGGYRQTKVRLSGIDAPEKNQPFGTRSRQSLAELIVGREVLVEWDKRDRYGRILGRVMAEGEEINLRMVREGMAWHYTAFSKSEELRMAEEAAREGRLGLWSDPTPVAPWDFRRSGRGKR